MLEDQQLSLLKNALRTLGEGFQSLPETTFAIPEESLAAVLAKTAERLHDNFPYHHPLYVGQMLKPPHPIAQLAYQLAMCLNPNNHALDGGRASSAMEMECVAEIASMFRWPEHLGHLCSGGTIANFEALWVARELTDGKAFAVSDQAHYTHSRLSKVLQVPCHQVPVDQYGRMRLDSLEELLQEDEIGTVIATTGTTGLGAVDSLDHIITLKNKYGVRVHVDAAYGGYFRLARNLKSETRAALAAIEHVDSVVIDPHKHGLQPYGCGCVLFRDRRVAAVYHHESPYTYFTSDDLHLGEISLECSRAGAAAVALWATLQLFPLKAEGSFSLRLEQSRTAALRLADWIQQDPHFQLITEPEMDLVVWGVKAKSASQSSRIAKRLFDCAATQHLHLAQLTLSQEFAERLGIVTDWDQSTLVCLRATVMKPEHLEWMPQILQRLDTVCRSVFATESDS